VVAGNMVASCWPAFTKPRWKAPWWPGWHALSCASSTHIRWPASSGRPRGWLTRSGARARLRSGPSISRPARRRIACRPATSWSIACTARWRR